MVWLTQLNCCQLRTTGRSGETDTAHRRRRFTCWTSNFVALPSTIPFIQALFAGSIPPNLVCRALRRWVLRVAVLQERRRFWRRLRGSGDQRRLQRWAGILHARHGRESAAQSDPHGLRRREQFDRQYRHIGTSPVNLISNRNSTCSSIIKLVTFWVDSFELCVHIWRGIEQ